MRGDKNALPEAGSGEASETCQDQEGLTGDRKEPGGRKGQRPVETRGQRQMRTVQGHPPGKSAGEPKALKTRCLYFNQTVFFLYHVSQQQGVSGKMLVKPKLVTL